MPIVTAITGGRYQPGTKIPLIPSPAQLLRFWTYWKDLHATHLANGCAIGTDQFVRSEVIRCLGRSHVIDYGVDLRIDGPWPMAGHRRNERMLRDIIERWRAKYLIAFPGENGTRNCVETAERLGIKVLHVGDTKMQETRCNIFDLSSLFPSAWIGITTNGVVKSNGALVMGRGVAQQARDRFKGIDFLFGDKVKRHGNHCHFCPDFLNRYKVFSFPVKHRWRDTADLELIARSAEELINFAIEYPRDTFYLPRPGCGNGGLNWEIDVKPVLVRAQLPINIVVVSL